MKKTVFFLLALASYTRPSIAQEPAVIMSDKTGWHKIGETTVDFTKDHDEIIVMGADRFASIKFKVTDAPIDLLDLEIYYESGEKQDVQVRTPINTGGESRTIDLNGKEKALKKIVFVYKTLPNHQGEKAHVEVLGLKTNEEKTGNQKAAVTEKENSEWRKIGERTVDFTKDRDEILVTSNDRFAALRFKVTEASVDLRDIIVYYENDMNQEIPLRTPITKGSESRVVDLTGGDRAIRKIVFVYKTVPNQREEKAHVEVWGLTKEKSDVPSVAVVSGDKPGWHKIAESTVDFKKDKDEIVVVGADRFAQIKFKVTDAAIDLRDLEIFYENGDNQDVQVRTPIAKGGESREINLNGGERALKKVVFIYKTVPNQREEKAHVELWGLKTGDKKSEN